jgi:hypothetical protein
MQRAMKPKRNTQKQSVVRKGPMDVLVHTTHPPPIRPQMTHRQKMRFQCITSGTQGVTYADLMDLLLVATSATAVFDVYDVCRVRAVEVWCASTSGGVPVTVSVAFNGTNASGLAGDGRIIADTVMGNEPAHVRAKPNRDSLAAQWNESSSAASAFSVVTPTGSIIDVDMEYRNTVAAPQAAQNVAVGATIGQFYYRGLDGLAIATTKYTPITGSQGGDVI